MPDYKPELVGEERWDARSTSAKVRAGYGGSIVQNYCMAWKFQMETTFSTALSGRDNTSSSGTTHTIIIFSASDRRLVERQVAEIWEDGMRNGVKMVWGMVWSWCWDGEVMVWGGVKIWTSCAFTNGLFIIWHRYHTNLPYWSWQ